MSKLKLYFLIHPGKIKTKFDVICNLFIIKFFLPRLEEENEKNERQEEQEELQNQTVKKEELEQSEELENGLSKFYENQC